MKRNTPTFTNFMTSNMVLVELNTTTCQFLANKYIGTLWTTCLLPKLRDFAWKCWNRRVKITIKYRNFLNPRRAGCVFGRPHIFGTPVHASRSHVVWKFQTQVTQGQVTRSRQVTSPHLSLDARHSYTDWPIALKLLAIDIRNSVYKMYIFRFLYRWPKDRSILRHLHFKSMGENLDAPRLDENHSKQ